MINRRKYDIINVEYSRGMPHRIRGMLVSITLYWLSFIDLLRRRPHGEHCPAERDPGLLVLILILLSLPEVLCKLYTFFNITSSIINGCLLNRSYSNGLPVTRHN